MPIVTPAQLRKLYTGIARVKPRLVGLDVGTTNVGVALSDPTLKIALPQMTLLRKECILPEKENPLISFMKENRAFAMVVGFPLLLDESESLQCEDIKLFIHQFKRHTGVDMPVVLQDELYTTQIAMEGFQGKSRRLRNEGLRKKDQNAAAVILQDFLDGF